MSQIRFRIQKYGNVFVTCRQKNKLKGKKFHRKKKNVLRNENVFIHQKDKIKTLSEQKKSLAEKNLKQEAQGLCREPVRDRLVLHVTREENFTMF